MTDIIETIDRLHAEATQGEWRITERTIAAFGRITRDIRPVGTEADYNLVVVIVNAWPALRDRLREAEARLANNYGPNGVVIRDLVTAGYEIARLQNALANAERKAKAFDAIASRTVLIEDDPKESGEFAVYANHARCANPDLLTAIEAATKEQP